VVDVRLGPGHPPVVQDDDPGHTRERRTEELLTIGSGRPGTRRLGLLREGDDHPAEANAVARLRLSLALGCPPLELAPG